LSNSLADFSDLYFQVSWWMLALISVAGIALFFYANRRFDKKLQTISLAVILLGIVLATLRFMIPTAREQVEDHSRDLISAVNKHDWGRFSRLLGNQTVIGTAERAYVSGRDRIVDLCKREVDHVGLESVYALRVDSQRTQTLITVSLEVMTTQTASQDRPVTSSWQFDFEKSGKDWTLDKITLLRIGENNEEGTFNPFTQ
jgi:hypothetical protein